MYTLRSCGYHAIHEMGFTIDRAGGSGDCLFLLFQTPVEIKLHGELLRTSGPGVMVYASGTPQWYTACAPMTADWFHFVAPSPGFMRQYGLACDTLYFPYNIQELSRTVQTLQTHHIRATDLSEKIASTLMEYLFLVLSQNLCEPQTVSGEQHGAALHRLRADIYRTPQAQWTIETMCDRLFISRSHLHALYKKMFHCSPLADVIASRVLQAQQLLSGQQALCVSEVAALCGYETETHFIRQFTEATGTTPSKYRKAVLR